MNQVTGTQEWKPPNALSGFKKDPRFRYRFVAKDRENRITHMLQQGWVIEHGAGQTERKDGGSSMDGATHYKGLVVMKIPVEQAEKRNKYYRDKGKARLQAAQAIAKMTSQAGSTNAKVGGQLSSAFGRVYGRHGRHTTIEDQFDTRNGKPPDIDPKMMQEAVDIMKAQQKENMELRERVKKLEENRDPGIKAARKGRPRKVA